MCVCVCVHARVVLGRSGWSVWGLDVVWVGPWASVAYELQLFLLHLQMFL